MVVNKKIELTERYDVVKKIGSGGMSNVYKGIDRYDNKDVAIKILKEDIAKDEAHLNRFKREINTVIRINCPFSVKVFQQIEINNRPALVMEYIDDHQEAKQILKREGAFIEEEAVRVIICVLKVLEEAHRKDIIHRDIKPQNILITKSGVVKLCDFGIATFKEANVLTKTSELVGSVQYIPPEVVNGELATGQSDIYSTGIVLFELLTGKLPYVGETAIKVALKHTNEDMPSPRAINPSISRKIEKIIYKATEKDLDKRYKSASEMILDLERYTHENYSINFTDEKVRDSGVHLMKQGIELPDIYDHGKFKKVRIRIILLLTLAAVGLLVWVMIR